MSNTVNRFGLFGGASGESLESIDRFVREYKEQLLKQHTDPLIRAKLLRSFHKAKPPTTENLLLGFIKDFEHEPAFSQPVNLFRKKLTALRQAKRQEAVDALRPSMQLKPDLPLSRRQQAWQQLLETMKRCVNNKATRETLGWHPHHHENYYLAKLRIQWQRFEAQYGEAPTNNLTETLTQDIVEERRQTVIEKHVEAQQALLSPKMQLTPTNASRQKTKLEEEKEQALEEINALAPQLTTYTNEVIEFAEQPADASLLNIFDNAIAETQRHERSVTSNPALFNLAAGPKQPQHALATLARIDDAREMKNFSTLFAAERATITETLEASAELSA